MTKGHEIYKSWSASWKEAMKQDDIEKVLALWRKPVPTGFHREHWKEDIGYRKNDKGRKKGEQIIEAQLLGEKGKLSNRIVKTPKGEYQFIGIYNDMRAAQDFGKAKTEGQVIADAFGLLILKKDIHPVVVEVKINNEDCWYALVENLKQIKLMRANEKNINSFLSILNPTHSLPHAKGTWGMVLASRGYYEKKGKLPLCKQLLERLKAEKVEARVALCSYDNLAQNNTVDVVVSNWPI